jgi:hypothetical protein
MSADITFETTVLPDAYPYVPYEASIAISGAASVISAGSKATGTFPPGLAIASDHVRITGTVAGVQAALPKVYTFTLSLTDTAGAVTSGTYTITVREPQAGAAKAGGVQALPVQSQMCAMWPGQF